MRKLLAVGVFLLFASLSTFGQASDDPTNFEVAINSVGYYANQTDNYLAKAARSSEGVSSETLETQVTTALLDVWQITTVVDRNLMWANTMTSAYVPPNGNNLTTPFMTVNSATCNGTTYQATGDLAGTIHCDLTNNFGLIAAAQSALNAISTGGGNFDTNVTAARNSFSNLQGYYSTAETD